MSPIIIFIEGNIAAGKSTALQELKNRCSRRSQYLQEPVNTWQNLKDSNGKNLLDYFYDNMPRFAYSFQSYAFLSRVRMFDDFDHGADIVFVERSIFSDKEVFAKNCFEKGLMTEIEWKLYNDWFAWMSNRCIPRNCDIYTIYLRSNPETCWKRLQKRSRPEEKSVELSYLQEIHQKHERKGWLHPCFQSGSESSDGALIFVYFVYSVVL